MRSRPLRASEAGHRFIALVSSLPGQVIVADHPWYDTMAGKPSWAQSEAVHDVLRSGSAAARHDLSRPASRRPCLAARHHGVRRQPRRHHRSRIRALLPTRSAGLHLHTVFLPGDRRPTAALPALRPPVTLPVVRDRRCARVGRSNGPRPPRCRSHGSRLCGPAPPRRDATRPTSETRDRCSRRSRHAHGDLRRLLWVHGLHQEPCPFGKDPADTLARDSRGCLRCRCCRRAGARTATDRCRARIEDRLVRHRAPRRRASRTAVGEVSIPMASTPRLSNDET